ncbi:MAG TPA: hypothetical protein VGR11_12625 [Solirubrobacteraceae bacterium]|nr:hypothetical protein [Solirubrobacteraceae bacterium]
MRATVDSGALLELAWAAPVAALIVVVAWGLVVVGTARAGEARRDGRSVRAALHVAMAGVGATLFVAAIVVGLIITSDKG